MKVLGIITEYNPFHNGHKYHIDEAKKITGADYVIAVMSGDFVQRGCPAIISKYDRNLMALNNGVDLVFELPVCYSTGSAQYFALGAVSLLNSLGIVDYICFGSEIGDIKDLEEAAGMFFNPTESFQRTLYSYIREGFSYPAARAKAAEESLSIDGESNNTYIAKVISEPNNILGIEYIKALKQIDSTIQPVTIKRHMANYHDEKPGLLLSSATAIRSVLEKKHNSNLPSIKSSVPKNVYDYFTDNNYITYPITIEDFSAIIKYKLLSESSRELSSYLDLSSDIADRIKNINIQDLSMDELSQSIKTKNITLTRVNRALIHVLLNIRKEAFQEYIDDGDFIYYLRLLGMKKEASHLIRKIKNHGKLPVITKVSRAYKQLDSLGMKMLNQDILATHLYNQVTHDKFKKTIPNEYKRGIITA
ncbi:MAG: nucleotidyltransferase [Clostridiales bacterium]|jgi:predicted nucleotidyltransferase|nr:nucleotidyltransferase [Clostridiales bacterium]